MRRREYCPTIHCCSMSFKDTGGESVAHHDRYWKRGAVTEGCCVLVQRPERDFSCDIEGINLLPLPRNN